MFKPSAVALLMITSFPAFSLAPVIYGNDDRKEIYEGDAFEQRLAASAATMILKSKLTKNSQTGSFEVPQISLRNWLESQFEKRSLQSKYFTPAVAKLTSSEISFCSGERFTDQPNPGTCSGFLVAPDLLVTAGHCVKVPDFCENYNWVFDYKVDPLTGSAGLDLKAKNIYSCKKVISSALSNMLGLDYGLIQLDRKVKNREPLEIRSEGGIKAGTKLMVIGSPSGLPLKIAGGAYVRETSHALYFKANLDAFQGNSGSAVFNAKTGVVEGILVRGEEDFDANLDDLCVQSNRCPDKGCRGEEVSRMTSIPEYAVKDALFSMAKKGDTRGLNRLTQNRFWIDIYGKDGKTAFMTAVENNQIAFAGILLAKGAEIDRVDAKGESALSILARVLDKKKVSMLTFLIGNGANLESKNELGETALLVAARNLNIYGVRALISQGADLSATNALGENILFAFTKAKKNKIVKELIELGVNDSVRNASGQTIADLK